MKPINEIIEMGCRFYGMSKEVLLSPSRKEHLVLTRFSIMKACRDGGYKLKAIGRALGKDHGSVMHGLVNVTPEKFGHRWTDHERFMAVVTSDKKDQSDQKGMIRDVDARLLIVQSQIDALQATKEKLLSVRAMFI